MTVVSDSLVGEVLLAWGEAVRRREDTGIWQEAGLARAALSVLATDADALRALEETVQEVAERFGCTPDESYLLAVAMLPEAHPSAHLLAGLLSGDPGPGRPTVALALESTGLGTLDQRSRRLLGPSGLLVSTGLLAVEGECVWLARRVRVPDRVAERLLGVTARSEELAGVLVQPPRVDVDVDGAHRVADALVAGEPLVWVRSPPGTAGAVLAAAACRALGVSVLMADLGRLAGEPGPGSEVRPDRGIIHRLVQGLALEAALEGSVLILLGAERATGDLDVLARAVVPVIGVARTAWDPHWTERLPRTVTAARLARAERERLWRDAVGPGPDLAAVLAMRSAPEEIALVGERVRADAERAGREPTGGDLRRAVRALGVDYRAGGGATATLDDLVLPEHTRREIERLIGWARDRDEVLGLGELQGKGGKGAGICALFSGSPGTGKTLAAHVLADSLAADLFQVDLSTVVDKYIGETEKNLERVFSRAESLNAVLFFDEADALFGSRSAVTDSRDRYANQEISYLLQRMEAFEGITVLATNLRGNLDPAFARRLHFMIHFPDPDAATRRRLWEHHLAQLPGTDPDDPVDLDLLASALEISGGDIRNIVLAAAYDAVARREPVGMRGVRIAVERELAKLGRRVGDPKWAFG